MQKRFDEIESAYLDTCSQIMSNDLYTAAEADELLDKAHAAYLKLLAEVIALTFFPNVKLRKKTASMKMNIAKLIAGYSEFIADELREINRAEPYEDAKEIAHFAIGYVAAIITTSLAMVNANTTNIIDDLDELENEWSVKIYTAAIEAAYRTEQNSPPTY